MLLRWGFTPSALPARSVAVHGVKFFLRYAKTAGLPPPFLVCVHRPTARCSLPHASGQVVMLSPQSVASH